MRKILILLGVFSLLTCTQDNLKTVSNDSERGSIKLSVNLGNFFIGGSGTDSPWNHVYQESAEITFSSTTSIFTTSVTFNPNDLSTFPDTNLPYDTYSWSITKTGDDVAVSDVLYIYGSSASDFTVDSPTTTVPLVLDTDFALVTVSTENLASAGIRYNGENTDLTIQDGYYFGYINTNNTPYTLQIVSTDDLAGMDIISDPVAYTHYNYQVTFDSPNTGTVGVSLSLSQNFVLEDRDITAEADDDLDGVPNSLDECPGTPSGAVVDEKGCIVEGLFIDSINGITIRCPNANVGDVGLINGKTYKVIGNQSEAMEIISDSNENTCVCTSKITDMSNWFQDDLMGNNSFEDISDWDVSNVTNMNYMFRYSSFNQDIGAWDVSNVITMRGMFNYAMDFNSDISAWDVSSVTDMREMFSYAMSFNSSIGDWDVSNVEYFMNMFSNSSFNQNIGLWDVTSAISMESMFAYNEQFNQDIGTWNVSNVGRINGGYGMEMMFAGATSFNQDLSNWCAPFATRIGRFLGVSGTTFAGLGCPLELSHYPRWGGCPTKEDIKLVTFEREGDFIYLDSNGVTIKAGKEARIGEYYDLNGIQYKVVDGYELREMIYNGADLSKVVTSFVTNFHGLFDEFHLFSNDIIIYQMINFNQDISSWDTSHVLDMSDTFSGATSFDQDISNWDTSNVENMSSMFRSAQTFNKPIGNWDTSNVKQFYTMFYEAISFNQNLSNWDVSNALSCFTFAPEAVFTEPKPSFLINCDLF